MEQESFMLIKTSTLEWLKQKIEYIEKQLANSQQQITEQVYSEKKAAKRIGLSVKTLQNLRAKGEIVFTRTPNGRRILYRECDLLQFLERNKVKLKFK